MKNLQKVIELYRVSVNSLKNIIGDIEKELGTNKHLIIPGEPIEAQLEQIKSTFMNLILDELWLKEQKYLDIDNKIKISSPMNLDTFSLDEGQAVLKWSPNMTLESYEDFKSWLELQIKKIHRSIMKKKWTTNYRH